MQQLIKANVNGRYLFKITKLGHQIMLAKMTYNIAVNPWLLLPRSVGMRGEIPNDNNISGRDT